MEATAHEAGTKLKRAIGQRVLLIFVVGDILGAGIYALVGEVGAEVGGAIWTAFLSALVLAVFTAFAYAELVTKYPQAAGAAMYTHRAFGVPLLTFVVAFAVMSSGIASASTLSRAFAGDYLSEFVDLPLVLAAIAFIVIVAAINLRGIAESVAVNVVLTTIEVIGLLIIIAIGVAALGEGSGDFSRNFEFKEGESVVFVLIGGTALAFYAMIGFEDSVNVAEEAESPSRSYPRALFGGIAIAGVLYLLVTMTASLVVPTGQLADSDAPLLEVVEQGPLGISTKLFAFIALMAVANSALINMIMASRIVYGMADQGHVSGVFARVLPERRTPFVAIAFTTLLAIVLISTGDLETLADTTVLLLLFVFTVVNVAVLALRRSTVDHDHFRSPAVFPVLGALVSVALIVDTATEDLAVFGRAALLIGAGVVLWALNRALAR
jgi:amino acid transporter